MKELGRMVDKISRDKGKEPLFLWGRLLGAWARLLTVLAAVGEALKCSDPTKGAGDSIKDWEDWTGGASD